MSAMYACLFAVVGEHPVVDLRALVAGGAAGGLDVGLVGRSFRRRLRPRGGALAPLFAACDTIACDATPPARPRRLRAPRPAARAPPRPSARAPAVVRRASCARRPAPAGCATSRGTGAPPESAVRRRSLSAARSRSSTISTLGTLSGRPFRSRLQRLVDRDHAAVPLLRAERAPGAGRSVGRWPRNRPG